MEEQQQQPVDGQQIHNPGSEVGNTRAPAGSQEGAAHPPRGQRILPEAAEQMLQDLADLPGRLLPAETMHHLKNAGRETVLALYSLWQSANRAARTESGEKVRKHIDVE